MLLEKRNDNAIIEIHKTKTYINSFPKDDWFCKTDKRQKTFIEDTGLIRKIVLEKIVYLYTVENIFDVYRFLQSHSNLVDVILKAHPQIRKYFPTEKLRLKLYLDPESLQWEYIIISICVMSDFVDEALNKQHEFEQDWWINASLGIAVNLSIDLEFE